MPDYKKYINKISKERSIGTCSITEIKDGWKLKDLKGKVFYIRRK